MLRASSIEPNPFRSGLEDARKSFFREGSLKCSRLQVSRVLLQQVLQPPKSKMLELKKLEN